MAWAATCRERGAGEILLTSIDRDGARTGYDLALTRAVEDDPTLVVERHADTRETVLSGMGDAHLELVHELMKKRSNLDAEFNVRKSCEAMVHPTYCTPGFGLKCDDTREFAANQQFVCMLTDSLRGANYRAEGMTPVQAEGNVRISCQKAVHPMYCEKPVRCESFFRN